MRRPLSASYGAAVVLLLFASSGSAQTTNSDRCAVGLGSPQGADIVFKVRADSLDVPPPQAVLVSSYGEVGLAFKFVRGTYGPPVPDFLVVSPSRGLTPGWVWVGLNRDVLPYMAARSYGATLVFALEDEPDKVCRNSYPLRAILLEVTGWPPPAVTSVVNAATLQGDFSAGTIISIFGTNLSTPPITARYDAAGLYPTELGNTKVYLNDKPVARLLYVSQERIDAVIPHSLADQTTLDLIVGHNTSVSPAVRIPLTATSPGIFTASASGGGLAIYNQDGTQNGNDSPAPKGSEILFRATGVGVWNRNLPDGSIALSAVFFPNYYRPMYPEVILRPQAPVSLTIGGQAAEIRSAGPAPGELFGTLQVIAVVPEGVGPGPQPMVLTVGENSNVQQQVTVVVQ